MSDMDYFEDDYEPDDYDVGDDFETAMQECGVGMDGLCGYAGSEFCDWDCPLLRFGFHGTEIDDDDEAQS